MSTAGKPRLHPLPKGYFGDAQLSDDERTKIRDTMRAQLELTLADELAFVHTAKRQVDVTKWRLAKRKRELRVFRRRAHTGVFTSDTGAYEPSVLSVGRIEGSIEDVVYGAYHTKHDEIQTNMVFTRTATDCTVLMNLERATPEDPFHYLGVKWFYAQLPASLIIKPRDWCVAISLGIERDHHGAVFGYYMLRSVDLRTCPAFEPKDVVRGKAQICFIYREPVPGVVEVYSHGLYDPAGELIQHFSTVMTTKVLGGVSRLAPCAEAKKLTLLRLRNVQFKRTAPGRASSENTSRVCAQCRGTAGYFSSLRSCGVCSALVCSQCHAKKALFSVAAHAVYKVPCCVQCITEAKNMSVRPAEPGFSISGEQYLPQEEFSALESSGNPDEQSTPPSKRRAGSGDDHDRGKLSDISDDLSELDVDQYQFSDDDDESGISEDDMEKLLLLMMTQRQKEQLETQTECPERPLDGIRGSSGSSNAPTSTSEEHSSMRFTGDSRMASEPGESSLSDSSGDHCREVGTLGSASAIAAVAAATAAGEAEAVSGMTPEQAAVYSKILALQSTANEAYWMAQANSEMMRSVPSRSESVRGGSKRQSSEWSQSAHWMIDVVQSSNPAE